MYVDIDLVPFIKALLDRPPNPHTGYICKYDVYELRLFISGDDTKILPGTPLIVLRGMTPLPTVSLIEIRQALDRLEAEGLVRRLDRWYAWAEHSGPRQRRKAALYSWIDRRRARRELARYNKRDPA